MKQKYEILNLETGEWDEYELSDEEYKDMKKLDEEKIEVLNAEYDIVCKIIAQNISKCGSNLNDLN